MEPELNPTDTGVEENPTETAPEGEGVSEASATAEPTEGTTAEPQPLNLDDLPEFQKYKSGADTRIAAAEAQARRLEEQMFDFQRKAEEAELAAKLRDLPPEEAELERARYDIQKAREEADYYRQQYEGEANLKAWARHLHEEYGVPSQFLNTALGYEGLIKGMMAWKDSTVGTPPPAPTRGRTSLRPAQHGTAPAGPSTAKARFDETPLEDKMKWTQEDWRRRLEEIDQESK